MSLNSRPAKRQRRSTVVLSDNDDDSASSTTLPLRRSNAARQPLPLSSTLTVNATSNEAKQIKTESGKNTARTSSARSSPKSSPEKGRKSKKLSIDDTKNKSLHRFFSKVTEEERWRKRSATPDQESNPDGLEDDIIDDESMDEAFSEAIRRSEQDMIKTESTTIRPNSVPAATQAKGPPSSSQRFRRPALPAKAVVSVTSQRSNEEEDTKPWAERYGPTSLEDVAVHKKKVQDVQKWLDDTFAGRSRQRILVLKGPAGSGKSTTISLLSHARRCEIVAWQNPDTSESGALSSSLQFAEFITRGGDYGALQIAGHPSLDSSIAAHTRILLVEDFPSSMTKNSNALESFRSVLLYAASNIGPNLAFGRTSDVNTVTPIVLIISETLVSSSTAFADSFTAQRLLGPELLNHPAVCVIEFNPVAPTYLSKAIDMVIRKEARDSKRRRIPGPAVLQKLAEMGDVRNAISSLQFLCTRGDSDGQWSDTVASSVKRGSRSNQTLSEKEENSIKLISSRETTLDMFHAAGKVCYNKREDPRMTDTRAEPPPKPPDHLMHLYKSKVSQVDVEDLLNETGTDIQTFVSTVHQNYILSCKHDDFVDYFDGCATILSDSELLNPDSRALLRSKATAQARQSTFQLGTSDSLRQDEISFQVATRGVLFNLPFPVSRASPPGGRKGDAFKMFYPASLRLWKPVEETNGLIDLMIAQFLGQRTGSSSQNQQDGGVSSWRTKAGAFDTGSTSNEDDVDATPRVNVAKDSLVLDVLPYMTMINTARGEDASNLKKITQMRGFNVSTEHEPDDETATEKVPASVRLREKVEAAHQSLQIQAQLRAAQQMATKQIVEEPTVEKLFIEDDDIEDD